VEIIWKGTGAKSRNELIEENAKLTAENAMLTREAELDRRSSIADLIGSVIKTFLRWGFSFGIVFIVCLMINRLAGQVTFADIAVNFIGSFTFTHSIAGVAAVSGIIYGLRQNGPLAKVGYNC
jgi:hypothetical protein